MKKNNSKRTIPDCEDIDRIYKNYCPVNIMENSRTRDVVDYRVFFVKLCLDYTEATNTVISKYIKRHHATINHYKNNFEVFCINNKKAYRNYLSAEKHIQSVFPSAGKQPVKNIEADPLNVSRMYIRRYHASKTKLNFYKEYSRSLELKIKTLEGNEV